MWVRLRNTLVLGPIYREFVLVAGGSTATGTRAIQLPKLFAPV
jgi:NADPH:quinone reductase-like Zn-dependent oxidoreductase